MNFIFLLCIIISIASASYTGVYIFFSRKIYNQESLIMSIFLSKIAKIPAIIEVMRPYVFDTGVFDTITHLHSDAIIQRTETIYDLLELNARIEHEFSFLMKLSVHIPELQKDAYFLYMRDFIMQYERSMRSYFSGFNRIITHWNTFVNIKNISIVGYILPGKYKETI